MKENKTAELIRVCAQVYWLLRNYSIDSRNDSNVRSAEFDQSMYGPDKSEWPGSPVGFSWDVEFIFENGNEESITLDAIYESEWIISADRKTISSNDQETGENIFEFQTKNTVECAEYLSGAAQKIVDYCENRKLKNA